MNVGELMAKLAKLPPDMPVVMAQDNEPVTGTYSVGGVEQLRMRRDSLWSDPEAWEFAVLSRPEDRDVDVCYLDFNEPARQIIDADVERHRLAIEGYDRDTRTLSTADQAHAELTAPGRDAFVTMPATLAALDAAIAPNNCAGCGKPSPVGALCNLCTQVLEGPRR